MGHPETSHADRVAIIERHVAGESLREIANTMGFNYYTIRHWWRNYQEKGWSSLEPRRKGPPQMGLLGQFSPLTKYVLLRLKRQHPGWGVDKLLLELKRRPSLKGQRLPKRSAAASYLAQFGSRLNRPRRLPTKRPQGMPLRANEPHQCWQIDFKGEETVAGCQLIVAPLMVCDEASGAPLGGFMHTVRAKGRRTGLTVPVVQQDLRQAFAQWGLPDAIRLDRDPLLVGSTRLQWPGTLLLWLIGLGITPIINRAYRPTDNAIVERNHWTWELHVLLEQVYQNQTEIQQATDQDFADRRNELPSLHPGCQKRPPIVAYPTLKEKRRPYTLAQETTYFDLKRVDHYLSQWEWQRTVDSTGKISLADRNYPVGRSFRRQIVKIHFDMETRQFVCHHVAGHELTRWTIHEVSQDYILGIEQTRL